MKYFFIELKRHHHFFKYDDLSSFAYSFPYLESTEIY